ncbi:hypothetical protein [Streptomyces capillispiralis]|uniref:Uncharacterized protein n=1 Tax=Streptomyces capillispiralis TaxID=68182 RepID=A0A561TAZ2_9ACTN|nr:hypothetical protein [Streptomyces capillispiralis]TWF84272.1 hypothetical protein FHX78_111206 [Streptomyces capillispiralis]GHH92830.1 hypothetical protein GCM10017779_32870 [Streptomyces capillispiralis]
MSHIDPTPGQYVHDDRPAPDPYRHERRESTARRTALTVQTLADVAAGFLILWIALHLLGANEANVFVEFVRDTADILSWWSQDIFTMDTEGLRVLLNHGLPALIYLAVGHGIAARLNRA